MRPSAGTQKVGPYSCQRESRAIDYGCPAGMNPGPTSEPPVTTQPTTSQLSSLRREAAAAGDYRMACIASLAINGFIDTDESDPAHHEALALAAEGMAQETALAECATAIAAAQAQAQDDE